MTNVEEIRIDVGSTDCKDINLVDSSLLFEYQIESNNTSATNSPVISNHPFELCCCLDMSELECGHSPEGLSKLQKELENSKQHYQEVQTNLEYTHQIYLDYEQQIDKIKSSLQDNKDRLDLTLNRISSVKVDMAKVDLKYKEERAKVESIQQSQQIVKRELEELAQRLFEEAHAMIAVEQTQQETLTRTNQELQLQLKSAQDELKEAQHQLSLIRHALEDQTRISTEPTTPHDLSPSSMTDILTRAQVETSLMHGTDLGQTYLDTLEDDMALMDFNDFTQLVQSTSLRHLHSLKYMKYSIREEIGPCLRFGPNPKLASKKIMEAILVRSCFIETSPAGLLRHRQLKEDAVSTNLWERFKSGPSVFVGCQACGRDLDESEREEVLRYRFRISYFDDWSYIDRYCRDRLMAVIEFYNFIRNLRGGVYKHRSIHELYQQSIQLKLQMFLARMGSLPHVLQMCGIDTEKIASPFNGEPVAVYPESLTSFERLSSSAESSITISTIASSRTSASS